MAQARRRAVDKGMLPSFLETHGGLKGVIAADRRN